MAERKRGRESAADMVRSLGLVLLIVIGVWFFARPPHSDEKKLRLVDPTSDVGAFSAAVSGAVVPRTMPADWKPTVTRYDSATGILRVGWNTAAGNYAEYAAAVHAQPAFLREYAGDGSRGETIDIDGTRWTEYRQGGVISLVHDYGTTTVVLGTVRDTATLDELRVLASRLAA
jgi:hypothetical protein